MTKQQTIVITISRQMASGGAYIGHLLAKNLGYKYIEREVLHRAARQLGVEISQLSGVEERRTGFLENMVKGFAFGTPEAAYIPPSRRPVYDHELFEAEAKIIRAVAERYNAVIVGRAGYSVLRERAGVINVFIHAPLKFRIVRFQEFHKISSEQAREELEESDRRREKFLKTMTGTDRNDARNYHVCVDAQSSGFDVAQKMILDLVEKRKRESGL